MNQLSRDLGAALHHQVAAVLRSAIQSGRYAEGAFLPAEEALTQMFGVSRATVRRALQTLEQEGLIERRQGLGTRVAARRAEPPALASLSSHIDPANPADGRSGMTVSALEPVAPPATVRHALGLGTQETAWRITRVRTRDGAPQWLIVNHFPPAVGERLRSLDFQRTTLLNALGKAGWPCAQAEETVGATLADPEVAAAIGVKVGAPLLELSRVMLDAGGRPIGHQLTLIPPERRKLRLIIAVNEHGLPEAGVLAPAGPSA